MGTSSTRILIIDDEEKLLFGLKAVMQREGFTVTTAHNGQEGLNLARSTHPEIILCDVMMPPPNGFTLKKMLKEQEETAHIPFIFLTARTFDSDKVAGLNMGADDYVTKPFQVDELVARVRAVLRRSNEAQNKLNQAVESQMEQMRRNIAANLSHEMRTPLGIILSTLELALAEKFNNDSKDMEWYLQTAQTSANRLKSLVDDLMMLYTIDQNTVSHYREHIDLDFDFLNPIKQVVESWSSKGVKLRMFLNQPLEIYAPRLEFTHSVKHLVENACKFGPANGEVKVYLAKNGVGGCILQIVDDGPGIPPELREKVFERYYQISQGEARLFGGLGVGLTIARAFAEAQGGSVQILNTPTGCSVQMILPPTTNA